MRQANYHATMRVDRKRRLGALFMGLWWLFSQPLMLAVNTLVLPRTLMAEGVEADFSQPAYTPIVDHASNGVPLIQVTTPNSAGLSVNWFRDFNGRP